MRAAAPESQDYYRLRAEWLRFKNHVIDANTELPTLAAVRDMGVRLGQGRYLAAPAAIPEQGAQRP